MKTYLALIAMFAVSMTAFAQNSKKNMATTDQKKPTTQKKSNMTNQNTKNDLPAAYAALPDGMYAEMIKKLQKNLIYWLKVKLKITPKLRVFLITTV